MSLAILHLIDKSADRYTFRLDTGSSPWWELVIGEAVAKRNNAEFVDGASLRLPLKGPESNNLKTGREISLSAALFNDEKRFIQLYSYKTKEKKGPAFSDVIEVVSRLRGKIEKLSELPEIRLPQNFSIMIATQFSNTRKSFSFEETPLSGPMSFTALLPLLSNLLPLAGNLLGGLMNKGGGGGGGTGNTTGGTEKTGGGTAPVGGGGGVDLKSLLTPENIKAVTDLITQLMAQNKVATGKSLSTAVSPTLLGYSPAIAPVLSKILTPEAIVAIGSNPDKLYAAIADAFMKLPESELISIKKELLKLHPLESTIKNPPTVYSEAKIAPALLAALPALMPLLEKAMDPNVINAIGDQPTKLLGKVQDGLLNLNKEQYRHIEAILPKGVNADDAIKQMIGSINTYNAISALPVNQAPETPQAKSVIVNALCHAIPIVEKNLSENGFEEVKEKTEKLADKIQNELLELQDELKKKVSKMMPELKMKKNEDATEQLSIFMQEGNRSSSAHNIFRQSGGNGNSSNGKSSFAKSLALLSAVLPTAVVCEYQKQRTYKKRYQSLSLQSSANESADPASDLLIQKIDEGKCVKATSISMEANKDYDIEIAGGKTIDVNGIPKCVYVKEKGISFALRVIANNGKSTALPKALVQVQIRNHNDTKVIVDKKFPLTNIIPGQLIDQLRLEPHDLNALPCDCDLLVHFSFAWKDNKNVTKGVRKTHAILFTDGYVMGRIGETIKNGIPLNNINTHRNFWHKVWESKTAGDRSKVNIICKYFLHYDGKSRQNAFIETKTIESKSSDERNEYEKGEVFLKMKSGMEISPTSLNQVLPSIGSYPSLSDQQLKALCNYEFKKQVDSAAQTQLKFRNKEGEASSLWVYPEVDLFKLTLKKANNINAYGNVLDTVDEQVVFVRPTSIHFIGTKN